MSKKKKIIMTVTVIVVVVAIIAIIAGAAIIVRLKGKSAEKTSGVYANKVSDVMYQVGAIDKYSGVVEAAETLEVKTDSEKTVKDVLVTVGTQVQVGTPLFTYDTDELSAKKDSATLELEIGRAHV